jgi:hypothetical protein
MSYDNLLILVNNLDLVCINIKYICNNNNNNNMNNNNKFEQKPGTGSIFKNTFKDKDSQPDYKGKIVLHDGTEQQIALWIKEGANGKFFSASLSDIYTPTNNDKVDTNTKDNGQETDLPF